MDCTVIYIGFTILSAFDTLQSLLVLLDRADYVTARVGIYHVAPEEVFMFDKTFE